MVENRIAVLLYKKITRLHDLLQWQLPP